MTTHTDTRGQESYDPAAEVVEICRDLIRSGTLTSALVRVAEWQTR